MLTSVGKRLRAEREARGLSLEELARSTRIPRLSLELLEEDRFDDLPGEVFVRGFLRAYARALNLDDVHFLAQYAAIRRAPTVVQLPVSAPSVVRDGRRVGVVLAVVLLLVLCTMALSFMLRPRGRDVPSEVSFLDVRGYDTTHQLS